MHSDDQIINYQILKIYANHENWSIILGLKDRKDQF
jgi:hypothetical protein